MLAPKNEIARCDFCGALLENNAADAGCLNCLLRAGLTEVANETNRARRFQHYQLCLRDDGLTLHELGRGAMGITYLATDVNLDSPVALKVINARYSSQKEARERFRREARTAAQLRHPNVASVFHFGETPDGQCFYAMELVEGETLEARVQREGPLPVALALDIVTQITRALVAAESHRLVHRDLKPSNVMVVAGDSTDPHSLAVKVIDFGLAKAVSLAPNVQASTQTAFSGTPGFASPEQLDLRNDRLDVRSDIYSLGATLFYLLTSKVPDPGLSSGEGSLPSQLPMAVMRLLRRMLAADPNERPRDARQLLGAIRRAREAIDRSSRRSKRRLVLAATITLLLLSIAGGIATYQAHRRQTAAALLRSVAVLPFENLSSDPESAYLSDGMQDEVLTSLGKLKDLKVISRTSVMSYRGKATRDLPQIGKELGVRAIVEGSIRRLENHVLVNVQLLDTATEQYIWSARYDRTVADSMTLPGELAAELAGALRATLSPQERKRLAQKSTDSPAAYELYLRGREVQLRAERSRENYLSAIDYYKQALALDPKFVLPRARLSYVQGNLHANYDRTNQALLAESKANAEEALRTDPNSAEAHLALARWAWSANDRDAARREVAAALRLNPNDAFVVIAAANTQQGLGWADEALGSYERAAELGPREPRVFYNYGLILYYMSQDAEARAALDRALELAPEVTYYRTFRAKAEISWSGDIARAKGILAGLPSDADKDGRATSAHCWMALLERDFPEALRIVQAYPGETLPRVDEAGVNSADRPPRAFSEGLIHFYAGDYAAAYDSFDSARPHYEAAARDEPDSVDAHEKLAWVYALMGWKDLALGAVYRVDALETAAKIPLNQRANWALVYAWLGDMDRAWPELQRLLAYPFAVHLNDLRLDPIYDRFREDPRFQKLLATKKP